MYRIRFRVRYRQGAIRRGVLVFSVLAAGLLATLTLTRAFASVPDSPSSLAVTTGMRQFYLSLYAATGAGAGTMCAEGYHFASLWEIADPTNLTYNTSLGITSSDSGAGPPSELIVRPSITPITASGWVRTGYIAEDANVAGQANCEAWSSDSSADSGTVVHLDSDWAGGVQDIGVWNAEARTCNTSVRVWCVQDHVPVRMFLPIVIRN